ncbi:MAG: hypothetical protein ACLQQ0_00215 [Limisphaerales bacterium]
MIFNFMTAPNLQLQSQNHLDNPPANPTSRRKGIAGRAQAADLQRFAYDAAVSLRDACTDKATGKLTMTPTTAKAVKELIHAWDTARDALRVLRGRGLPASVRSKAPRSPVPVQPLDRV